MELDVKIEYKNKLKIINLILGFVWTGLGAVRMIFENDYDWVSFMYVALGILYLVLYIFQTKRSFIQIKEGVIKVNADFGCQKMILADIKSVRKFAGDYILNSTNDKITIRTQMMDQESFALLNNALEKLDISWE